jgi:RNA polymerase sigma-32 factor
MMSKDKKIDNATIVVLDEEKPVVLEEELAQEVQEELEQSEVIDITPKSHESDVIPAEVTDLILSKGSSPAVLDPLKQYIRDISRHKLLSKDEETELIKELLETGDINAAKKLVLANLRLVVKIAMEYRSAHRNIMDLIQEGNMGLMKAVSKYDPTKGAKLSYYASWWIKSYILKFILDNFRLIKIGTTAEQKKLFYNLMREKERLMNQGLEPDVKLISQNLGVSEKAVIEMDHRLSSAGGEVSIDTPIGDSSYGASSSSIGDMIMDENSSNIEEDLAHLQNIEILQENLKDFVDGLKERDREIFKKRLLSEVPLSLQAIADQYGVSRERIRQIESRLLDKLKVYMSDYLG